MENEEIKSSYTSWVLLGGALLIIFGVCIGAAFLYEQRFQETFYPGVSVGSLGLGGKTYDEAQDFLVHVLRPYNEQGIVVQFEDRAVSFLPVNIAPFDPDIAREVYRFEENKSLEHAWSVGRRGPLARQILEKVRALFIGKEVPLNYSVDSELLVGVLDENFADLEEPAENAEVVFIDRTQELSIDKEKDGWVFDRDLFVQKFKQSISKTEFGPVEIVQKNDYPDVSSVDIEPLLPQIEELISIRSLTLTYNNKKWTVSKELFRDWLNFISRDKASEAISSLFSESGMVAGEKIEKVLSINEEKLLAFLDEEVRGDIKVFPQEAKFEINAATKEVVKLQGGAPGKDIDILTTRKAIEEAVFVNRKTSIEIATVEVEPRVTEANIWDLGISEIIGSGYSNMQGSPSNRRHNIAVGAAALHGLLIAPQEEFSLLKALGEIDAASGYLPELVIKGNKTIPEYGGGLCQIGTTTFRATLSTGLPVTQRRNHSYQVPYYNDADGLPGTDATIYDPAPDYRFLNDTENYVLIQTRIETNDIYFDFWGTLDGRSVEQSKTLVYNVTPPPPTKFIETLELEPGEKKCTESPHNGADAQFTYAVTYEDGEEKEETFVSHYRPWQEVCLIGVEELEGDESKDLGVE